MNFIKKKVLKCLRVSKVVDIGLLIPVTIHQATTEVVYLGLLIPSTLPLVIMEDMLAEVDIGHKRQATIPLEIVEEELMVKG